ncbi:unnamed protein product, partial [Mesorhabditis belari]|uniref:Uncharacterized protein n=1 Tax=Mesorhabditis belari TaxID=2138241 RepID=A0AAF3FBH1_9BILA
METKDRRERFMRRHTTLRSSHTSQEDAGSSSGASSLDEPHTGERNVTFLCPPQDNFHLQVPTLFQQNEDRPPMERPPHQPDVIEKIPMRARSQSWLIRTRHLNERKVSELL